MTKSIVLVLLSISALAMIIAGNTNDTPILSTMGLCLAGATLTLAIQEIFKGSRKD